MSKRLCVVLGAGSSYDCISDVEFEPNFRPPLAAQLFENRSSFNAILRKYPGAEALSDLIRARVKNGDNLETVLRQIASEENVVLRKQFWEVPLYLQELLGEVSDHYVRAGATKFHTLVRGIEAAGVQEVGYLTLNYDLFLERALTTIYGTVFNHPSAYLPDGLRWFLVKLHGSVNWGRRVVNVDSRIRSAGELLTGLKADPVLDSTFEVLGGYQESVRYDREAFHYPALAVPVEGKTGFVCPQEHLARTREFLASCTNFLVIGFGGLDKDLLDLLGLAPVVHSLLVVCGNAEASLATVKRLSEPMRLGPKVGVYRPLESYGYPGGFSHFIDSGALARFLGSLT